MTVDTLTNDEILVGGPFVSEQTAGTDGITLAKGTMVALITATQKFDSYDGAGAGGQELIFGVLLEDFDSTVQAGQSASVLLAGSVNEDKIIFLAADTLLTTRREARTLGLYYKKVLSAT